MTPLADLPPRPAYTGAFEAHLTVGPGRPDAFRLACAELGAKAVLIELARGEHPSQPMTTTHHRGALDEVLGELRGLAGGLEARGFAVTRMKLEALADVRGVPEDDRSASDPSRAGEYFEYHAKVVLRPGDEGAALARLVAADGAHLSRNAYRLREDGREERFVTCRHAGVGRRTADARFGALLARLARGGYAVTRRIREYAVYDTHSALDRGWLGAAG